MGCMPGDAKMTKGYRLPAPCTPPQLPDHFRMNCETDAGLDIIHTVGPIYYSDGQKSPILLASCYRKCLDLAKQHSLTSIAFPSLSTGVYGYDIIPHQNAKEQISDSRSYCSCGSHRPQMA
jgi:O-acetyl-ADP-ribose deacetylase